MNLPTCCTDFDIQYEHLFFPELMDEDGQEFVKAHGIDRHNLADLRKGAIDQGDGVVKIQHRCRHLTDEGLCSIYDNRPLICQTFDCATRHDCACQGKGRIE